MSSDGGPHGVATLSGPISFPASSARAKPWAGAPDAGLNLSYVQMNISSGQVPTFCGNSPDGTFDMVMVGVNNDGGPIAPATYFISQPVTAERVTVIVDSGVPTILAFWPYYYADAGSITVTSVDPTFAGSFSLHFGLPDGGGSPLNGTFDAPYVTCL
jgi:hypothetical protein